MGFPEEYVILVSHFTASSGDDLQREVNNFLELLDMGRFVDIKYSSIASPTLTFKEYSALVIYKSDV